MIALEKTQGPCFLLLKGLEKVHATFLLLGETVILLLQVVIPDWSQGLRFEPSFGLRIFDHFKDQHIRSRQLLKDLPLQSCWSQQQVTELNFNYLAGLVGQSCVSGVIAAILTQYSRQALDLAHFESL